MAHLRLGDTDPDWVQLSGWSPGIVFNYPIRLGKSNPAGSEDHQPPIGANLQLPSDVFPNGHEKQD